MKKLIIAWIMGFVVAMTLAARWQRMGAATATPGESGAPSPIEPSPVESSATQPSRQPGGMMAVASAASKPIIAGAKQDFALFRRVVQPMRPAKQDTPATDGELLTKAG